MNQSERETELEKAKYWLLANREYLLGRYLNQWVAVDKTGVIASGQNMEEAAKRAVALGRKAPLLAPIRERGPFGALAIPSASDLRDADSGRLSHRKLDPPMEVAGVKHPAKHKTEMRWLREQEGFLEENYAGKWVAVKGTSLIAIGDAFDEAARGAEACGVVEPVIVLVRPKELQGIFLIR